MTDKNDLRKYIRQEKKKRTKEELFAQSVQILTILEQNIKFKEAKNVMLYASLPDEVQTLDFLEKWRSEKNIILPVVDGDDIIPTALEDGIAMEKGSFNIPEPKNNAYCGGFDLMVVPGMAFDRSGNRLGRGKGYYDRFLSQHKDVYTIGICFGFQLLNGIPAESHDRKVDEVITIC